MVLASVLCLCVWTEKQNRTKVQDYRRMGVWYPYVAASVRGRRPAAVPCCARVHHLVGTVREKGKEKGSGCCMRVYMRAS
jgi:hypothetical protein